MSTFFAVVGPEDEFYAMLANPGESQLSDISKYLEKGFRLIGTQPLDYDALRDILRYSVRRVGDKSTYRVYNHEVLGASDFWDERLREGDSVTLEFLGQEIKVSCDALRLVDKYKLVAIHPKD